VRQSRSSGRATSPTTRKRALYRREQDDAGFQASKKIHNKIAFKVVQNGLITMKDLPRACKRTTFSSRPNLRSATPRGCCALCGISVAWQGDGMPDGEAYEHALKYAQERLQFGRPIASFQLIQEPSRQNARERHSFSVHGGAPRRNCPAGRPSWGDHHAALAKGRSAPTECARRSRGPARSSAATASAPTITVARFFADAEVIYNYEGYVPDAET